MPRFVFVLALFFLVSFIINAQENDRSDYKLLWKISGKGLTKPSYLFGTMHVRDNRAFDFSDSVLLKIQACDAFALEINPDSLSREALTQLIGLSNSQDRMKKYMTDAAYNDLDSIMKKKTGASLKQFKSPMEVNAFLIQQFARKDKSTFLDMWLYGIARSENKIILGLEDLQDQIKLLQADPARQVKDLVRYIEIEYEKLEDMFQAFIDEYHNGDIEAIHTLSKQQVSPDQYESFINARNKKMAANIVKAIQKQSIFIAVGAAHLPGDDGIINLLIKSGYTVTPVPATFTGLAAKFPVKKKGYEWANLKLDEAGYSIDMPGKPVQITNKALPEPMQATVDLVDLSFFASTHFMTPANVRNKSTVEILDAMVKNMSTLLTVNNRKNMKVGEFDACEFESANENQYFKIRLIITDRFIYYLTAGSSDEATMNENALRFFDSFKVFKPRETVSQYELFEVKEGAFSVQVPGKVLTQETNPVDSETGKKHKIHVYYTTDGQTGESFVFRYNDLLPGIVALNDSIYLRSLPGSIMDNMSGSNLKMKDTTLVNFRSVKFDFDVTAQNLKVTGLNVLRGSRYYLFFTIRLATSTLESTNDFFSSVSFLPYDKVITKPVALNEEISLSVPVNFEQDSALISKDKMIRYSFTDVNSGMQYSLQSEELSYYAQDESNDSYFNKLDSRLWKKSDSIISKTPIKDQSGYEYWIKPKDVNALTHVRFMFGNESLISLWSFVPTDYRSSTLHDEVFNSLKVKPSKWSLFSDKTDLILKNILSTDSLTRTIANDAINDHSFSVNDLPKLYEALRYQYPDDAKGYQCTWCNLFKVLREHNDDTTLPFIKDLYGTLPDSTSLRDRAIGTLVALKTEASAKTAMQLIQGDKGRKINGYIALDTFYDSLSLMNVVANDLLDLEPKFRSSYTLYNLVKSALDSNVLQMGVKLKVIQQVEALGEMLLNEPRLDERNDGYESQHDKWLNYTELITAVPFSSKIKAIALKLHELHDTEIMAKTIVLLLKNQVKVPSADINTVAQENLYRLQLYFELNAIKAEKQINKKYLTPRMIGDSDLVEYLTFEDGYPDSLQFLVEKKVMYKGAEHRIFIYRYYITEYEEWSLAISGPYALKPKAGIERGEWTNSFYEDFDSNEDMLQFIKEFVEEQKGQLVK